MSTVIETPWLSWPFSAIQSCFRPLLHWDRCNMVIVWSHREISCPVWILLVTLDIWCTHTNGRLQHCSTCVMVYLWHPIFTPCLQKHPLQLYCGHDCHNVAQFRVAACSPLLSCLSFFFYIDKITLGYLPVARRWPAFLLWLDTEVDITHDWLLLFKVLVSRSCRGSTPSFNYTFVQKWKLLFALEKPGS